MSGSVSDGYHTFDELYDHRNLLFVNLVLAHRTLSWISRLNADGSAYPDWFVAGIELNPGQVSYHLPAHLWDALDVDGVTVHERAPWDGHAAADVVERLKDHAGIVTVVASTRGDQGGACGESSQPSRAAMERYIEHGPSDDEGCPLLPPMTQPRPARNINRGGGACSGAVSACADWRSRQRSSIETRGWSRA